MSKKTYFEFTGQFQGYQFSNRGLLRNIELEVLTEVYTIRLDKACQVALWELVLSRQVQMGDWLWVKGAQSHKKQGLVYKATEITPMLPVIESALLTLPCNDSPVAVHSKPSKPTQILVCQKSSCRKRGSQGVQRCLEQTLSDRDLAEQAKIKETGCLKHCSKGPNIVIGKDCYRNVSEAEIPKLVAQHFQSTPLSIPQNSVDVETVLLK